MAAAPLLPFQAARTALELLDDPEAGYRDLLRVHLQLLLAAAHDDDARTTITLFMGDQATELSQHIDDLSLRAGCGVQAERLATEYLALFRGFVLVRLADPALAPVDTVLSAVAGLVRAHLTPS